MEMFSPLDGCEVLTEIKRTGEEGESQADGA